MTLEQLLDQWESDSQLDRTDPIGMTEQIPKLHSKYLRYYTLESLILKKLEGDSKVLWKDKLEFYTQGPNEVTKQKGWQMPAKGRIMKSEVQPYLESDSDIINLKMKVEIAKQKTEVLQEIVKAINNRSYLINHVIQWTQWSGGH